METPLSLRSSLYRRRRRAQGLCASRRGGPGGSCPAQCIARGDIAITFAAHHIVRDMAWPFESDNWTQTSLNLSDPLRVSAGDSECKVERPRHEHFGSTKSSTDS